jgi:YbbR domain-containing protein
MHFNTKTHHEGAVMLVLILIIGAVALLISLSLGLSSISENQISLYQSQSTQAFLNADGCAEEALTKLNRNNLYTGETITLENTTCTITVTGSGPTRTVTVSATNTDYTHKIQIGVIIYSTFSITSWQELTT